jgi:hypothetical protein
MLALIFVLGGILQAQVSRPLAGPPEFTRVFQVVSRPKTCAAQAKQRWRGGRIASRKQESSLGHDKCPRTIDNFQIGACGVFTCAGYASTLRISESKTLNN